VRIVYNADMNQTVLRVVVALVWVVGGAVLLAREWLFPAEWYARKDPTILNMVGGGAVVLGAFRIFQLVIRHRRRVVPSPNPLRQPPPVAPREYIPELDFNRKEPAEPRPQGGGG
jgi:hypothetical protein